MTEVGFVHLLRGDEWRVFPCLVLDCHCYMNSRWPQGKLLYVDETGGIRIEFLEHYTRRISAGYWVFASEIETMFNDIYDDVQHRGLWYIALADARQAMIQTGRTPKE